MTKKTFLGMFCTGLIEFLPRCFIANMTTDLKKYILNMKSPLAKLTHFMWRLCILMIVDWLVLCMRRTLSWKYQVGVYLLFTSSPQLTNISYDLRPFLSLNMLDIWQEWWIYKTLIYDNLKIGPKAQRNGYGSYQSGLRVPRDVSNGSRDQNTNLQAGFMCLKCCPEPTEKVKCLCMVNTRGLLLVPNYIFHYNLQFVCDWLDVVKMG